MSRKERAKAAVMASEVEKLGPNNPQVLNAVGEDGLASNEAQAAITAFQKLITAAPTSAGAYLQLARAHYTVKDMENTRTDLEKAAQLAPTDATVEQQFSRFGIETNSVPRELSYLDSLADRQSSDPSFNLFAGDLLIASGNAADALGEYQKGLAKR